jgi:hypothetical protein
MKNILLVNILLFSFGFNSYGQNQAAFYKSFDGETTTGVKGKAKCFDGYFTNDETRFTALSNPKNFTVEAWIAVQEYASNVAAIADRELDFKSGYLLGINHKGNLSGSVSVNNQWKTVVSTESLPLLKWTHVAMRVENGKKIEIFINGQKAGSLDLNENIMLCDSCALSIGKTQTKTNASNTERSTSATIKTQNRFDGLIDELYIHNEALTAAEILQNFTKIKPAQPQPLQFRQMPSGGSTSTGFGAVYTHLKYAAGWDALWRGSEYPDIVVKFENTPIRYVFWRGTSYIPAIVNEKNMWMTDQSLEHWGTGECYEAMGDKQARYTHVRIIENTPARVVVHWRYALAGIRHQLFPEDENGWSDWADEYWTIYPDGIAARKQVLWSKRYETDKGSMQWQETIFFCQPGTRPQDNVDMTALTFMDMSGNKASYSWENGPPKLPMFKNPQHQPIELIHFKAQYKPFSIFDEKRVCQPFSFGNMKEYTTFPNWNHWPVQQVMSDGRNANAPDKPSHSSLTGSNGKMQIVEKKEEGVYWASSLKGMTTQPIDSLMNLAKSWHHAPAFKDLTAGVTAIYDKYQRGYVLTCNHSGLKKIGFTVSASAESPVCNLPIVLENYNQTVDKISVNGKVLKMGKDFYVGQVAGLEQNKTVLFINMNSTVPIHIKINDK